MAWPFPKERKSITGHGVHYTRPRKLCCHGENKLAPLMEATACARQVISKGAPSKNTEVKSAELKGTPKNVSCAV